MGRQRLNKAVQGQTAAQPKGAFLNTAIEIATGFGMESTPTVVSEITEGV